jgi:hypothetical protein
MLALLTLATKSVLAARLCARALPTTTPRKRFASGKRMIPNSGVLGPQPFVMCFLPPSANQLSAPSPQLRFAYLLNTATRCNFHGLGESTMKEFADWVEAIGAFGAFIISIIALLLADRTNKRLERWQFSQRKEAQLGELVSRLVDADTTHTVRPDATGNDRVLVVAAKMEAYENAFEKYKNY